MATSEKKLLNPKAVEFRPFSSVSLSVSVSVSNPPFFPPPAELPVIRHLPTFAPPPLQLQPVTSFYFQRPNYQFYNHHLIYTPKMMHPPTNYFYFPKSDLMLPVTDDGLGLITSPTSPTSPFEFVSHPKPSPKKTTRKGKIHSGRVRRRQSPGTETATPSSSVKVWVKKFEIPADADGDVDTPVPLASYPFRDCTSLMIRNIPVRLSRSELLWLLDEHCREENEKRRSDAEARSEFDFLYLPIDFKRRGNLGYAFVNFTTWEGASRLYNSWKGTTWKNCSYNSKKICQVDPAKFQGKELKKHLENSKYSCESDEYLAVELNPPRDGSNAEATKMTTVGTRVLVESLTTLGL